MKILLAAALALGVLISGAQAQYYERSYDRDRDSYAYQRRPSDGYRPYEREYGYRPSYRSYAYRPRYQVVPNPGYYRRWSGWRSWE